MELLRRFSPYALYSFIVVGGSGIIYAFFKLSSITDLVTTAYGKLILAKSILFAFIFILAMYHRNQINKRNKIKMTVIVECIVMLIVVVIAGMLATTGS
jgi:putative copper export protein